MKRLLVVLLCTFSAAAFAKPDVKPLDDGVYWSLVAKEFNYYVDTVAQLCYVVDAGNKPSSLTVIPCKNLKKRPEWAAVITWE